MFPCLAPEPGAMFPCSAPESGAMFPYSAPELEAITQTTFPCLAQQRPYLASIRSSVPSPTGWFRSNGPLRNILIVEVFFIFVYLYLSHSLNFFP